MLRLILFAAPFGGLLMLATFLDGNAHAQVADGEYMQNDVGIIVKDGRVVECGGHFDGNGSRTTCDGLTFALESRQVISVTTDAGVKLLLCKSPPPPQGSRRSIPECGKSGWFFR